MKTKKWIEYASENGERWEFLKNGDEKDGDEDSISVSGNQAIYRKEMLPADMIMVGISPRQESSIMLLSKQAKSVIFI